MSDTRWIVRATLLFFIQERESIIQQTCLPYISSFRVPGKCMLYTVKDYFDRNNNFRAIWFSCPSRWSPSILFKSLFKIISRFPVCIISHNYVESIFMFIHPFVCVFVCYFSYLGHIFQTLKREVFSFFFIFLNILWQYTYQILGLVESPILWAQLP